MLRLCVAVVVVGAVAVKLEAAIDGVVFIDASFFC